MTRELKSIIQDLIDENQDNVRVWLAHVAFGKPAEYEDDPTTPGKQRLSVPAVQPDPAKALDLLARLGEFAAPKLARTEMSGPGGTPLVPPSVHLYIEGPDGEQESS